MLRDLWQHGHVQIAFGRVGQRVVQVGLAADAVGACDAAEDEHVEAFDGVEGLDEHQGHAVLANVFGVGEEEARERDH